MKKTNQLILLLLITSIISRAQEITINQVGYLVYNMKIAVVPATETGNFQLIDNSSQKVKFIGKLSSSNNWPFANQLVKIADFSSFNDTGTYYVKIDNSNTKSNSFKIGFNTFYQLSIDAMRFFYLSRASIELFPQYAGVYARPAGHPDNQVIIHETAATPERPSGTIISTPGGWYDAGDYNKYIVNSGISTYTILAIAEHFPDYAANLKLNIPESNNKVPDIIDEALYNLRWMLSMQDPNDGGVYNKCSNMTFEGMIKPYQATNPRYVVMKTTAASLDMAAVAAQASRILRNYESSYPGLSDSCLKAAIYAYQWAKANPAIYFIQPEGMHTGGYSDNNVTDELKWTSMELYLTTKNELYIKNINFQDEKLDIPGWRNVFQLALFSLIHNLDKHEKNIDTDILKSKIINYSDSLYQTFFNSAYKVPEPEFYWGSNSVVTNSAFVILQAYYLTGNKKYKDYAVAALDYLLGRNPTKYSFVTGFGTLSPMNPHDRKSASDEVVAPIPGMLVGGPNPNNTRDCGTEAYPSILPALCYLDRLCSFSTNEIAINWNASLAYMACAIQALESKKTQDLKTGKQ
jgi:endoglucanase